MPQITAMDIKYRLLFGRRKAQGGLKNMYNIIEHLFLETGFPAWLILSLGIIAIFIEYWEDLTK